MTAVLGGHLPSAYFANACETRRHKLTWKPEKSNGTAVASTLSWHSGGGGGSRVGGGGAENAGGVVVKDEMPTGIKAT